MQDMISDIRHFVRFALHCGSYIENIRSTPIKYCEIFGANVGIYAYITLNAP